MTLIAMTYVKGRPGVTTTALGLAVVAPVSTRAVVVECDPAGGDLRRRFGMAPRPSLVDFTAAARGASYPEDAYATGTQELTVGGRRVPVAIGPASGAQTRAALPELTGAGQATLTGSTRLVITDCGRLDVGGRVLPLLRLADVVLVMTRARADEIAHLREHLGTFLDADLRRLVVLLGAGGRYPASEVADTLARHVAEKLAHDPEQITVLGPLPRDDRAAAILGGERVPARRWPRLPLIRALSDLLPTLTPAPSTVDPIETSTP